jgi:hypothetical protein
MDPGRATCRQLINCSRSLTSDRRAIVIAVQVARPGSIFNSHPPTQFLIYFASIHDSYRKGSSGTSGGQSKQWWQDLFPLWVFRWQDSSKNLRNFFVCQLLCLFEILIGLKGRIPGRPEVTVFCFCFKKSAVIHKVNTYMDPGRATCRQSIALPTELPIAANHKKNLERLWTNPYG